MPDLYFNPYPGAATEVLDGARALVVTAKAVEELRSSIPIEGIQAEGEGIYRFCMVRDSSLGCALNLSDLLPSLSGTDRTIAQRFLTLFSMGKVLDATAVDGHERHLLKDLELPVPILEYALLNAGLATTVTVDTAWQKDTLEFTGTTKTLPNIWGQQDLASVLQWVAEWRARDEDYCERISRIHSARICSGAIKTGDLTNDEWDILSNKLSEAKTRNFTPDGYLVKDVEVSSYGPVKQIKQLGTGLRLYISCTDTGIIIGGFYKKGAASSPKRENLAQNKAIIAARNRINNAYNTEKLEQAAEADAVRGGSEVR